MYISEEAVEPLILEILILTHDPFMHTRPEKTLLGLLCSCWKFAELPLLSKKLKSKAEEVA